MRAIASLFIFLFSLSTLAQADMLSAAKTPGASRGNAFNPDISANGLFLLQNSNRGNDSGLESPNGFSLQEAEIQFASDVDPYSRFVGTFSIHQEFDDTTKERPYVIEPEEAYAETLELPYITARVGKFKAALGKHNQLHTHAYPFIDAPLMNTALLGDEGLNDVGVSVAGLIPVHWFSEVTLQGLSGQGEGLDYFNSPTPNNIVGVLHWKNLFDLTDDLTFEVGGSAASGKNVDSKSTQLYGADMTFKWRPNGSRERAVIFSTEALKRDENMTAFNEHGQGLASWLQYQFALRWWAEARAEYLELKGQDPAATEAPFTRKQSALIGFIPSEFSAFRLQYDLVNDGQAKNEQKITLQFNYSIGAHPAHAY